MKRLLSVLLLSAVLLLAAAEKLTVIGPTFTDIFSPPPDGRTC